MSHLKQPEYLTDEQLRLLAELIGHTWLDNQLKRYQQFHEHHSLPSRWWHRPPDMSPIVPLVFWARPSPRITLDAPFGVWRGDPTGILFRLLAAIDEFRDYWDHLPEGRGRGRLRYTLRHPWSFFGIRHEMRLATHIKGSGYHVEPLFFDPTAEKGGADIMVKDGDRTYDVQCKARNPSVATSMPYEVFQFFAGSWARMVADSGRSYFLFLHVKQKMDLAGARRLLDTIRTLIHTKLTIPERLESTDWSIQLEEMGYGPGMVSPEELRAKSISRAEESLYIESELIKPASALSESPHIAGCHITGSRRHGLEHYVFSTAERAAKAHSGKNPLIVSVNLYQKVDMSNYMNGPSVYPLYEAWIEKFFSKYLGVALLILSANYDRYLLVDGIGAALGTKYFIVESQHWENVLPHLGIG